MVRIPAPFLLSICLTCVAVRPATADSWKTSDDARAAAREAGERVAAHGRRAEEVFARQAEVARQIGDIRRSGPDVRAVDVRIAEAEGKLHALGLARDRALVELRRGMFCSKCLRTATEIEKAGERFAVHLGRVDGRPIAASPQQINQKAREFDERIAALLRELEELRRQRALEVERFQSRLDELQRQWRELDEQRQNHLAARWGAWNDQRTATAAAAKFAHVEHWKAQFEAQARELEMLAQLRRAQHEARETLLAELAQLRAQRSMDAFDEYLRSRREARARAESALEDARLAAAEARRQLEDARVRELHAASDDLQRLGALPGSEADQAPGWGRASAAQLDAKVTAAAAATSARVEEQQRRLRTELADEAAQGLTLMSPAEPVEDEAPLRRLIQSLGSAASDVRSRANAAWREALETARRAERAISDVKGRARALVTEGPLGFLAADKLLGSMQEKSSEVGSYFEREGHLYLNRAGDGTYRVRDVEGREGAGWDQVELMEERP